VHAFRGAGLLLALTLAAFGASAVHAQVAIPKLETRVTDLTGTLTAGQQSSLEEKLQQFEARKGSQIAVLILPTTQPEDIAQFGIRLAEAWKIGRAKTDDGAILIIAKDDRTMRIEVGRGLEGALPDITAGRIINDTIAPLFRQGDFFGGVNAGLDRMMRVVDGEPLPPPDQRWQSKGHTSVPWPFIAIGVLAFFGAFNRFGGRVVGAIVVGACLAFIVWWFTAAIPMSVKSGVVGFLIALFSGGFWGMFNAADVARGSSRVFRDRGGWGGGGFGGGGFGGGFGGGGGGGFSGGGGSFGGGGASGRW
jgi:uncharacterized protein